LVVAGPGTGKTTLFKQLLHAGQSSVERNLVLTFINNLADELRRDLGSLALVFTFHSFCHRLLRRSAALRAPLPKDFHYFPKLPHVINEDWDIGTGAALPKFVPMMRTLVRGPALDFYFGRADYYEAVSYDDSVFRIHEALTHHRDELPQMDLILLDEFQDFNLLEVSLIELLGQDSRLVVAGDDDQALYAQLRSSDPNHIRTRYGIDSYANFNLPFCMRCTRVIVEAVDDIVRKAGTIGRLAGRIDKPYLFFPPSKQADSNAYPTIKVVQTTVQRLGTGNYFGRYIVQEIEAVPSEQIEQSHKDRFPTVLIIASDPYRSQVVRHLTATGYKADTAVPSEPDILDRNDALRILKRDERSNLGWRILIETDQVEGGTPIIRQSVAENGALFDLMPSGFRDQILAELTTWVPPPQPEAEAETPPTPGVPTIKVTSFEGSKGLSAQHVFIVGIHRGEIPRGNSITDLEICKFLVALTRTRKQCHLIYTSHFGADRKMPSPFIRWIDSSRVTKVRVDRDYWNTPI
jgi:superfamily I DNA/RNA helicase